MKHVLLTIPYGLAFRNIVCCDILSQLTKADTRVTVLLPPLPERDTAAVRAELPTGVSVGRLEPVGSSLPFTYLKALKQAHYSQRTSLDAFQIKYRRRRQQRPLFHVAMAAAERVGRGLVSEVTTDALLGAWRQPFEAHYRRMLTALRPEAIALTKPGFHPDELPLTKAARALGIPTIAIDTTWDNMASKRPPYIRPDRLTVWNHWMEREAIDYYGFVPEAVSMASGAQFDVLFGKTELPDRAATLSALGLDPSRQLIVFAMNGPMYAPDNPGYIRLLLDGIRSGRIDGRPNLVVRLHPFDRDGHYEDAVAGSSGVVLQRGFALATPGAAFECLPTHDDVRRYGALMVHADLMLNQASTTTLDAMVTGTPVVNIAFDLAATHADTSIARVYGFTHYQRIVDSGAVRLAHTADELFDAMNTYLRDRTVDAALRLAARNRFVGASDGNSGSRIAACIMSMV